jgi:hypothetical protein
VLGVGRTIVTATPFAESRLSANIGDPNVDFPPLIDRDNRCINEALIRWHILRDSEPPEDNNVQLDAE